MCGIYLQKRIHGFDGKAKKVADADFAKIKHRGPDATRIRYHGYNTMIGFHRLAIVDPTGEGMQPFEDERYACVINGEIYNYKMIQMSLMSGNPDLVFKSHSDCEVVLHLFRSIVGSESPTLEHVEELVKIMDGEFAFIIHDTVTDNTFYGVDELRARPLFMSTRSNNGCEIITLCSEQKALTDSIRPVPCGTIGIIQPVGYKQYYDNYKYTEKQYFDFEKPLGFSTEPSFDEAVVLLEELMTKNVAIKLNPEREFGFLLSGGLDSSLVCGIAAKQLAPMRIKTFTVGFDKNASDVVAARKVAAHIGSIHTEFIFTYEDGIAILPEVIKTNETWDQTSIRAGTPMTLLLRSIKKMHPEMAVIYSGEMADELFMGYLEWQSAPDTAAARAHVIKRLKDITYFDGARADRTVAGVSCELRLPFFGKSLLNFALSTPAEYFMPQHNEGIEKYILRKAFTPKDGEHGVIPNEVLWRTKNAFSDATSIVGVTSWKQCLMAHAEAEITDSRFAVRANIYPINTPQTKEDMLYREIFDSYDYTHSIIPYKWLPAWAPADLTDSSATALEGFKE
jgi:asparagine synthase (glutamine-hydrolysing)